MGRFLGRFSVAKAAAPSVQAGREATGSIGSAGQGDVTVSWAKPFANTNYTVSAQVVEDQGGESLRVRRVRTISTTGCVVNVVNNALVSRSGVVHATALSD